MPAVRRKRGPSTPVKCSARPSRSSTGLLTTHMYPRTCSSQKSRRRRSGLGRRGWSAGRSCSRRGPLGESPAAPPGGPGGLAWLVRAFGAQLCRVAGVMECTIRERQSCAGWSRSSCQIPPGIWGGQRMDVAGFGECSAQPGNLVVLGDQAPHPRSNPQRCFSPVLSLDGRPKSYAGTVNRRASPASVPDESRRGPGRRLRPVHDLGKCATARPLGPQAN